jgi:PAS domain S-box-containing protein
MSSIPVDGNPDIQASLELLYHVSREIATSLDLATLLERILFLSIENIGAINGSIIALDDSGSPVESTLIINLELLNYSTSELQTTLDEGLAGWVVRNRQSVLISDTSKDERWLRRPDDAEEATGSKSVITAPFLTQGQVAGVITLVHPSPGFFQVDHKILVEAIADQAAIGVLNARLHAETQRSARIMTALAESATVITGTLNLPEVLRRILERITNALDTEAASLALINKSENILEYAASTLQKGRSPVGLTLPIAQGIAGWVAKHETGIVIPEAYADDRFCTNFDEETGFKTRAIACVPIITQGEIIGTAEALNPRSGGFDSDALQVLTGISSLAGTAIHHAQLFQALEAAHKRYHELFEGSITSILITDWRGKIIEVNQQTTVLTKYSENELIGLNILALLDIRSETPDFKLENITAKEINSFESVIHSKIGSKIPVTIKVQPTVVEGTSFLQWVFRDDTERKELEELREDLLSMIYHDLRSPLSNVLSSLETLTTMVDLDDDEDESVAQSLIDIALRSTKRIKRLTASLLDINLLETGHPVQDRTLTSPETVIYESLTEFEAILENRRIKTILEISEDVPKLMINTDMIQRVIINLVENAIKFTPPEGTIKLSAYKTENLVRMSIQDTGPGIPKENLETIFEKYTRLHSKPGQRGYGLGLAYCQLAVEGHGGRIWAENMPDGGISFMFTIPISEQPKTSTEEDK